MKQLLLIIAFISSCYSYSQVASNYTFSETTGTYTAITGGTQLVTTTAGATAYDTDGDVITLAVANRFTFNGTVITSINMTADGALWLNPGTSTLGNGVTGAIASTGTAAGIICPLNMDLRSSAMASTVYERRWQDDGTEDIFQWQNCARYVSSTNEKFSFQVRINKSTGVIRVVYGGGTVNTTTTYQPSVGLRGTANTDYNNRRLTTTVPDASPNWGAPNGTTAGTSNTHTCRFVSTASCFPAAGLIFIWTPVVAVSAPANDNSAGAIALTINSSTTCTTTTTGTSIGATQTLAAQSLYGTADDDVWYKFTATAVSLDISVARGTMGDLVVEAYTSSLVSMGAIDNYSTSPETGSFTNLTIGSVYYIRVYSFAATVGSRGTFTICMTTPIQPPTNDNASGAITLIVNDPYVTGTNEGATASTTAPTPTGPAYYGADVWYKVVVPSGGTVQIRTAALVLTDVVMEVYSGTASALTYITYNDDSLSSVNSMPYLELTSRTVGETIWIRVWDYSSDNSGTFKIRVTTPVALPITLLSFTGYNTVDGNLIQWQTASEQNNDYFTLERGLYSNGSVEWLEVHIINGAGTSNTTNVYGYFDLDYPDDINYYRLSQTDYDGTIVTHDIISINNRTTALRVVKVINLLGQEVDPFLSKGVLLEVYEDGTTSRIIR